MLRRRRFWLLSLSVALNLTLLFNSLLGNGPIGVCSRAAGWTDSASPFPRGAAL